MEPDEIIRSIIIPVTGISAGRVVFANQSFKAPKDQGLYIVISEQTTKTIGVMPAFDPDAETQKIISSFLGRYDVEVCSKNREAKEKKDLIIAALFTYSSRQKTDEENVKITRAGDIIDISQGSGAGTVHRYIVPLSIFYTKTYTENVAVYENYRSLGVLNNG